MKISKLFHWLYAFLMLLPVFGVLFKVGYVMLNDNAFESYSGTYAYNQNINFLYNDNVTIPEDSENNSYVQSSVSNNFNSLLTIKFGAFPTSSSLIFTNFTDLKISSVSTDLSSYNVMNVTNATWNGPNAVIQLYSFDNTLYSINAMAYDGRITLLNNSTLVESYIWPIVSYNVYNINGELTFYNFNNYVNVYNLANRRFSASEWNTLIYSNAYVYDNTLSSVFYSSLQEINNTEFFSWAKDSFLVQPIMYIGALFGITNPHPIFTFMSYWLAISIIWLVFDLVMYVPLLVHRWIDKGVIE